MTMGAASPHLKLDELLANASGEAVSDRARAHLTACGHCQDEAERWDAVAAGVRHLVAAVPVPPWQPVGARAAPSSLLRSFLPRQRSRRRVLAVAAAMAPVAGGVSYGLVTGSSGDQKASPVNTAGFIAVRGCPRLVAALGTATHVHGASLLLQTAGGQPVTVTTSAAVVSREVPGSVSDLTNGGRVFMRGVYSGGKATAYSVSIGVAPSLPESGLGRTCLPVPGRGSGLAPCGTQAKADSPWSRPAAHACR